MQASDKIRNEESYTVRKIAKGRILLGIKNINFFTKFMFIEIRMNDGWILESYEQSEYK